jgi:hypothetical protein
MSEELSDEIKAYNCYILTINGPINPKYVIPKYVHSVSSDNQLLKISVAIAVEDQYVSYASKYKLGPARFKEYFFPMHVFAFILDENPALDYNYLENLQLKERITQVTMEKQKQRKQKSLENKKLSELLKAYETERI